MAAQASTVQPVDLRVESMKVTLENHPDSEKVVPGLAKLFQKYLDPNIEVKPHEFLRALLKAFRHSSDPNVVKAYQEAISGYSEREKVLLERFAQDEPFDILSNGFHLAASPSARHEMTEMQQAHITKKFELDEFLEGKAQEENWFEKAKDRVESWFGLEGSKAYENAHFQNFGRTVDNYPLYTFVPKTVKEVRQIVKFAKAKNMSVRCAGYRHSWAPIFSEKGQVLISMLDLERVENLPDLTSLGIFELFHDDEPLMSIGFMDKEFSKDNKRLVRIGTAVTNDGLRRWCIKNGVAIPINPVIVELTVGGTNAPICHGAGMRHQTISDLVRAVEYVDVNGKKQNITDPAQLKAASGCFGLLGVVTHLTLELDKLTVAKMVPAKMPVSWAIPPPDGETFEDVPAALLDPWNRLSNVEKQAKLADFERRAQEDYYSEWFWFPFSDYAWVNTWNQTFDPKEIAQSREYPSESEIFLQFVEAVVFATMQNSALLVHLCRWFDFSQPLTTIMSLLAMYQLPDKPIFCPVSDALHFQRALQNLRMRDMEVQIPLQPREEDPEKPDFQLARKAWWDAIRNAYKPKNRKICPQNLPLEMRMVGNSEVIMAPFRGNNLGTCSIEIITLEMNSDIWVPYGQELLDQWMSYKDKNGQPLKTRPHWSKDWYCFTVNNGKSWLEKLKNEDYKDEIAEFKGVLTDIGKSHGWTLKDLKSRFSNDMWNSLIFSDI